MTPVKCEQCACAISDSGGKCSHGVPIQPKLNKSSAFKRVKTIVAPTTAALFLVLITAMVRHFVLQTDRPPSPAPIQATDFNEHSGGRDIAPDTMARSQHAIYRVSSVTVQDNSALDPMGLLFDLKRVVDQSPEKVAQVLGEAPVLWPDERSVTGTLRGKYKRGKIEIGYADEGARFVTIHFSQCKRWQPAGASSRRCIESDNFTNYKYQQDVAGLLQALGLPKEQRPSLNDKAVLRWNEASGIHQVSVIPNDLGGIDYIHVISTRLYACLLERSELECQAY